MLSFEFPWIFYALPLPVLAYWLLPKVQQQQAAVRVPFYQQLAGLEHQTNSNLQQRKLRVASLIVIWSCLVAAASGPNWIGDPISLPASGRDLLLAVDLSGSMKIEDMQVRGEQAPRIVAVKAVLNDFIERRKAIV
ncbi:hypothetical protein [Oceanicoccus sp. KOV_DT_Chl]|uniref:hypothetical protein n=1 Tax=Oceanicoccus sp. KOV_DT_Chl TaxID=1904639 RepID=UPI00350F6F3F